MSDTVYKQEFCKQCGQVSPIEVTRSPSDSGGQVVTEYCKVCKGFNRTETNASGAIVQQQLAI